MLIRPFQEADADAVVALDDGSADGAVIAAAMGGYEGHRGWVNYLAV